jgi:hypothetical protein
LHRDLGCLDDASGLSAPVQHDSVAARLRQWIARALEVYHEGRCGPLWPGEHQGQQLVRQRASITKREHVVALIGRDRTGAAELAPVRLNGRSA